MENNKKKPVFPILFVVLLVLICTFVTTYITNFINIGQTASNDSQKYYVAVIAKSKVSQFWKSVFAGAGAAGTEYNLKITFDGPDSEEDYQTQNQMIARAVEDGADAIVFSAADYNANAETINQAAQAGVKIIVIDSDVNSDQVSCRISTDNYQAGRMAGEATLACDGNALYVGIVNFDANTANGQQREQGFRDVVSQDSRVTIIDTIHVKSTTKEAKEGCEWMLRQHPQIDVIATFNEWTSLGVGYAVQAMGLAEDTTVIAFDSNIVSVGMLETGEVDALIVQNPYAMGYLGVETAYKLIHDISLDSETVDTATTIITRDNMYDENSQKMVFSFD